MLYGLSASTGYNLYTKATDMRKGFNGLSGMVRNDLGRNPLSGEVFIFLNRRRTLIKLLVWDSSGYVIYYKRLEAGTFELPSLSPDQNSISLTRDKLLLILEGIELKSVKKRKRFLQNFTA
jgi:transposase